MFLQSPAFDVHKESMDKYMMLTFPDVELHVQPCQRTKGLDVAQSIKTRTSANIVTKEWMYNSNKHAKLEEVSRKYIIWFHMNNKAPI